ncbi:Charged multivesicular body protein 1b [Liparis tanakae]|uniref:Charged multivesicular body protein 1b n=1 Tax=Liparis tanakae TaxID=230148 RepID=A0A4Z2E4K2_9TELE|nr:Charged multivesicular body protein 1b [Liparis tanakae]
MSKMEKHLFNLKLASKERQRNFKNCDKDEKEQTSPKLSRLSRRAIWRQPRSTQRTPSIRSIRPLTSRG